MLEQNYKIIVHPLDFLYLQLPCLSTSIKHLRTREMTLLRSMDPTDHCKLGFSCDFNYSYLPIICSFVYVSAVSLVVYSAKNMSPLRAMTL